MSLTNTTKIKSSALQLWVVLFLFVILSVGIYYFRDTGFESSEEYKNLQQFYDDQLGGCSIAKSIDIKRLCQENLQRILQAREENSRTSFQIIAGLGGFLALISAIARISQTDRQIQQAKDEFIRRYDIEDKRMAQSDRQIEAVLQQIELQKLSLESQKENERQKRVSDRFSKATEQLGSERIGVRIGAMANLEIIAKESVSDAPAVVHLVATWIRANYSRNLEEEIRKLNTIEDLKAALNCISRSCDEIEKIEVDLRNVYVYNLRITGLDISDMDFTGSKFENCYFESSKFNRINFRTCSFQNVSIFWTSVKNCDFGHSNFVKFDAYSSDLDSSNFRESVFSDSVIEHTEIQDCGFVFARIGNTVFRSSELKECCFNGDDVTPVDISGAEITMAQLADSEINTYTILNQNQIQERDSYVSRFGKPKGWSY